MQFTLIGADLLFPLAEIVLRFFESEPVLLQRPHLGFQLLAGRFGAAFGLERLELLHQLLATIEPLLPLLLERLGVESHLLVTLGQLAPVLSDFAPILAHFAEIVP